jgi:hypothetical protein
MSAGTSVDFAVATVGAAAARCRLTTTVLSLSVNVTDVLVVDRAQPSGTEILKPPVDEVYGTYTVLSGMSPGGLLSTATGDSVGTGDCPGAGEVVGLNGGVELTAGVVGVDGDAVLDPPHAPKVAAIVIAPSTHPACRLTFTHLHMIGPHSFVRREP